MVKEFIDLAMSECPDRIVLTQSNRPLRYEMRHLEKRDWLEIGGYLYELHGDYLRMEGRNVRYMEQVLQTQSNYEPLREDKLDSESAHDNEVLHTAAP